MNAGSLASLAQPTALDLVTQGAGQGLPNLANGKSIEAARQFEGMLMANLFQCLRKTVTPSGLFGNSGSARSTYEYLLDQAVVTQAMTAGKGWGLSDRLVASWKAKAATPKGHSEQDLI